jgi:hypothetical protein
MRSILPVLSGCCSETEVSEQLYCLNPHTFGYMRRFSSPDKQNRNTCRAGKPQPEPSAGGEADAILFYAK